MIHGCEKCNTSERGMARVRGFRVIALLSPQFAELTPRMIGSVVTSKRAERNTCARTRANFRSSLIPGMKKSARKRIAMRASLEQRSNAGSCERERDWPWPDAHQRAGAHRASRNDHRPKKPEPSKSRSSDPYVEQMATSARNAKYVVGRLDR